MTPNHTPQFIDKEQARVELFWNGVLALGCFAMCAFCVLRLFFADGLMSTVAWGIGGVWAFVACQEFSADAVSLWRTLRSGR